MNRMDLYKRIGVGAGIALAIIACSYLFIRFRTPATSHDTAAPDPYAAAILTCYHQKPGSDADKPLPNDSIQYATDTTRMFINMPKSLYPEDISHSWTTIMGNATGGYVSNGGLPGEAFDASPGCWSTYVELDGSGEVDLRVKSTTLGVPDYFVRFIVSPV